MPRLLLPVLAALALTACDVPTDMVATAPDLTPGAGIIGGNGGALKEPVAGSKQPGKTTPDQSASQAAPTD